MQFRWQRRLCETVKLKDAGVGMSTVRDHSSLLQHLGLTVYHRKQKGYEISEGPEK